MEMGTRSDNIWNCLEAKENRDMDLDLHTRSNRTPDFLATKKILGLVSGHSRKMARKVIFVLCSGQNSSIFVFKWPGFPQVLRNFF